LKLRLILNFEEFPIDEELRLVSGLDRVSRRLEF